MRLASRLAAGYGLVIAVMAGMGGYQLALIANLQSAYRDLAEVGLTAVRSGLRLRRDVEQIRDLTQRLFIRSDRDYIAALGELRHQVGHGIADLAALDLSGATRLEVTRLVDLWKAYRLTAESAEAQALAMHGEGTASRDALDAALDAVVRQLDEVLRVAQVSIDARVAASAEVADQARWVSIAATLLGVVAALAVSLLTVRSVVRPVRRLVRGTHALAAGSLSHRVEPAGGTELAALAADFNAMAARLEALDSAKRDFVSAVSHDLKAPLASIQETLRFLLDGMPGPVSPQQERLLGLALGSAERLAGMIADLLDLARLDAGALRYRIAPHDLRELATIALRDLEPQSREKRLRMAAALPAEPLTIACDGPLVVRVLENLLSNAVRFSPPGGAVELTIHHPPAGLLPPAAAEAATTGEAVLVEVSDQGPGVPDADKERVFERFHGTRPARGVGAGTGLGLAIARSVVAGHRGAVWLRDRPGGGTVAAVLLPLAGPPVGEGEDATVAV
jgi:signal transduction histidine kinase